MLQPSGTYFSVTMSYDPHTVLVNATTTPEAKVVDDDTAVDSPILVVLSQELYRKSTNSSCVSSRTRNRGILSPSVQRSSRVVI